MFAVYLLLGVLTLPLSAKWSPAVGTLAFLATICGYLQPVLLMVGVASLRSSVTPERAWRTLGIASALVAAIVTFFASLALHNAIDSFSLRLAPRAWALAAAALFSVVVFVRRGRETGSLACSRDRDRLPGVQLGSGGIRSGCYWATRGWCRGALRCHLQR